MPSIKGLLTRWKFLWPGWGENVRCASAARLFSGYIYPRASTGPAGPL